MYFGQVHPHLRATSRHAGLCGNCGPASRGVVMQKDHASSEISARGPPVRA